MTSPNATLSKDIFAGMPSVFSNTTLVSTRVQYAARDGATTLMSFDNGDPALLFTKYGNGYVVAWLPPANTAYLSSTEADTINERLITHLMALRVVATTATTVPATTVNTTAAAAVATPADSGAALGSVSVYSSPLSANVYIDGVYKGIAPVNLTDISAGSHALKLALAGYYDYDTTITVVGGGAITAFGSLPPRESATAAATTAPVAVTHDRCILDLFEPRSCCSSARYHHRDHRCDCHHLHDLFTSINHKQAIGSGLPSFLFL